VQSDDDPAVDEENPDASAKEMELRREHDKFRSNFKGTVC